MLLTIHELATNTVEYDALAFPDGNVRVGWGFENSSDNEQFISSWKETGGPRVEQPARRGFGSRLITIVLAAVFGGQVHMEFAIGGLKCVLRSPAAFVARDDVLITSSEASMS